MVEYLSVRLRSQPGEAEADFKARITAFWSHYLRTRPDDYEKVYAEATKFETDNEALTRQYMVEANGVDALIEEMTRAELAFEPIDRDDVYSKYEAAPPEWFWIEH
jgi:hypothetical protein